MGGTASTDEAQETAQSAVDQGGGAHGHADHGSAGGHDADHAQEQLGPVDWRAWGAGALGAVAAGVIAVALYLASHQGT